MPLSPERNKNILETVKTHFFVCRITFVGCDPRVAWRQQWGTHPALLTDSCPTLRHGTNQCAGRNGNVNGSQSQGDGQ